jgi:hypothetical protein
LADGGLGSGSLRDAVLQFNADTGTADDIIQLEAGTYSLTIRNVNGRHETAGLTGDLNLNQTSHRWIIQGAGPSTIIDASQLQDRVFQIVNPGTQVMFQDLVIQGGLAQDNGADGAQAGTTDALGGGILNNGGTVTLDQVVVQNNVARAGDAPTTGYNARGGGFYSTGGALTLARAALANNQATGGPAGMADLSNGGSANGGGLYATGGSLDISASSIASNQATGGLGGPEQGTSTPERTYGGDALGGGLYVSGGSISITASGIASNHATGGAPGPGSYYAGTGGGGGLYNGGALTVSDSILSGNRATNDPFGGIPGYGGGIYNFGTLTLELIPDPFLPEDLVKLLNEAFVADRGDTEKHQEEIQHLLVFASVEVPDCRVVIWKNHVTVKITVLPGQLLSNAIEEHLKARDSRNHHPEPVADQGRNVVMVIVDLLVLCGIEFHPSSSSNSGGWPPILHCAKPCKHPASSRIVSSHEQHT